MAYVWLAISLVTPNKGIVIVSKSDATSLMEEIKKVKTEVQTPGRTICVAWFAKICDAVLSLHERLSAVEEASE